MPLFEIVLGISGLAITTGTILFKTGSWVDKVNNRINKLTESFNLIEGNLKIMDNKIDDINLGVNNHLTHTDATIAKLTKELTYLRKRSK